MELVRALEADAIDARELALEQLILMGPAALEMLREAVICERHLEVRGRVSEVIRRLEEWERADPLGGVIHEGLQVRLRIIRKQSTAEAPVYCLVKIRNVSGRPRLVVTGAFWTLETPWGRYENLGDDLMVNIQSSGAVARGPKQCWRVAGMYAGSTTVLLEPGGSTEWRRDLAAQRVVAGLGKLEELGWMPGEYEIVASCTLGGLGGIRGGRGGHHEGNPTCTDTPLPQA